MVMRAFTGTRTVLRQVTHGVSPICHGRASLRSVARRRHAASDSGPTFNIHGRHVDVTPDLEDKVKDRLMHTLNKLHQAEFLESEGDIEGINVRLMNSQAEVDLYPHTMNKQLHDTYLQQGVLKGIGTGGPDALSNFGMAVDQIETKLHKWRKGQTVKKDYRAMFRE